MSRLTDPEREELVASARALLGDASGPSRARLLLDDPIGFDRDLFGEMCSLGWAAMHLPVSVGGYGASIADVSSVWREMGRHLTSTPLIGSAVVAAAALLAADNPSLAEGVVPALASGERIATVALCGDAGHYTTEGIGPRWTAGEGGGTLSGTASFVLDGHVADQLVVFALDASGSPVLVVVDSTTDGVTVDSTAPVDRTRRLSRIHFEGTEVADEAVAASGPGARRALAAAVDHGSVAMACDSVGVVEVVVETTTEYVKERRQFGRPVGSFQAIKHRLADDLLLVEAGRVASEAAAEAVELDALDPERVVAVANAKSYVGDAAVTVCGDSIRSHGGIGFTWEHDAHLYLKRALLNQAMFGTSSFHRRRIADAVLPR